MFATSRWTRLRLLYLLWARVVLSLYQGLAYSRGVSGRVCDMFLKNEGPR